MCYTAKDVAQLLLKIQAVTLNVKHPYRYTSGLLSPIYCDNRLLMSYPKERDHIIEAFLDLISKKNLAFDVIAGTATAGIPHAAFLSDRLKKPMVYVRPRVKVHGKQNQIEGLIKPGQRALIIEDLVSSGQSVYQSILALRQAGAHVENACAIFSYQLPGSHTLFSDHHIELHTLTDFDAFIQIAKEHDLFSKEDCQQAQTWRYDPLHWK